MDALSENFVHLLGDKLQIVTTTTTIIIMTVIIVAFRLRWTLHLALQAIEQFLEIYLLRRRLLLSDNFYYGITPACRYFGTGTLGGGKI